MPLLGGENLKIGTGLNLSTGKDRVFQSLISLGIANKHFCSKLNGYEYPC